MYHLAGSVVLGWALGGNDAGNVFGTAVASRMIRYRTAVIVAAACIVLGAVLQGRGGLSTLGGLSHQTAASAMLVTLVAGLTVIAMTLLKLPVSSNQAVVGAVLGMGLRISPEQVAWGELGKVFTCWVSAPVGACALGAVLYPALGRIYDRLPMNLVTRSIVLKFALLAAGAYSAYAMGANSAGNVTGVFYGTGLLEGNPHARLILTLVGGASIALGMLTFSRHVMFTVGSELVQLGAFSALVAVLAEALTVHLFAFIGVPVSTSQAMVGSVVGIGLAKGLRTIDVSVLRRIVAGWVTTPLIGGAVSYLAAWLLL